MSVIENLQILLSLDKNGFEKGMGASLAQLEVLRGAVSDMLTPLQELGDESRQLATDFETAFAEVSTIVDTSTVDIEAMKQQILDMSEGVPQSAAQLTNGLYQVISAGVDAKDAMAVLNVSAKAATAGLSDTATSVDVITTLLNSYGMEASQAGAVSDVLFKTVERGKTRFDELAPAMGTFSATAASLNVQLPETAAAMATMTKNGLATRRAATSLDGILREILNKKEISDMFKQMGYDSGRAGIEALGLQGSIAALSDQAKKTGQDFTTLWGQEALRGAQILSNNLEAANEDLIAVTNSGESMNSAFNKINDTTESLDKRLKNTREQFKIGVGQDILPLANAWKNAQIGLLNAANNSGPVIGGLISTVVASGDGLSRVVNLTATWGRNLVAIKDGVGVIRSLIPAATAAAGAEAAAGAGGAAMAGGAKAAALGTKLLNNALKIGVIGAIIATTAALVKLGIEMNNFRKVSNEIAENAEKNWDNEKKILQENSSYQRASIKVELQNYLRAQEAGDKKAMESAQERLDYLQQYTDIAIGKEANHAQALGLIQDQISKQAAAANQKRLESEAELQEARDAKAQAAQKEQEKQLNIAQNKYRNYIAQIQKLGGDAKLDEAILQDVEKINEELPKLEEQLNSLLAKVSEERRKIAAESWKSLIEDEEQYELDSLDGTAEYYDQLLLMEENRHNERLRELEGNNAAIEAELQQHEHNKIKIQDQADLFAKKQAEKEQKKQDTELAKLQAEKDKELEIEQAAWDTKEQIYLSGAQKIGDALASQEDIMKKALRAILNTLLDYVERVYLVKLVEGVAMGNIASLFRAGAATAAMGAARGAVASFDVGGIPMSSGLGMLHPGDVVVNPTSDNAMMEALTERLAEKINGRAVEANLVVDGEILTRQVVIPQINRANKRLPRGRDVFDESRQN